jgi:coenzyme F420-reducing hydrogenase delta subunit
MVDTEIIFEGRVVGQDRVSYTDPLLCKACGQCVSACPAGARSLSPDVAAAVREKIHDQPGIICFACKFGWGYTAEKGKFADIKELVPVICLGKVDIHEILSAFTKKGAEGVLLLGCGQGDCHFQDGNHEAQKRIFILHRVLEEFGIEKERLEIVTSFDPKGNGIPVHINNLKDRVKSLGPIGR